MFKKITPHSYLFKVIGIPTIILCCGIFSTLLGQTPIPDTTKILQPDTSKKIQATAPKDTSHSLVMKFSKKTIVLDETDIVTNVLFICNNTFEPLDFTVRVSCPYNWTSISNDSAKYHANPGDSIFIPVRIVPTGVKGGSEYVINVYLISSINGTQLTNDYFFAGTKRLSRWSVNVLPSRKIYFMNHSDTARFDINILNEGNQPEDLVLTLKNFMSKSTILDTTGRILHANYFNTVLKPGADTDLAFKAKYIGTPLNFQYSDLEQFAGYTNQNDQNFSIWANTQEAKQLDSNSYARGKEIDFAKLSDITSANPFGGQVVPVTADLNTYNILGIQPVMNLNLYGNTLLNNDAHVFYNANLYYSTYFLENKLFNGSTYYAGYFDTRGDDIQAGNIGLSNPGGFAVAGDGVKGDYAIDKQNTVGGGLVDGYYNSYLGAEVWDKYKFMNTSPLLDNRVFTTSAGLDDGYSNNSQEYYVSEIGGFNITKNQSLGFNLVGIDKVYSNATFLGHIIGLNYNGNFLQNKLSISEYFYHAAYDTSAYSKNILTLGNYDTYRLSKTWIFLLQNNYNSYPTPYYVVTPYNVTFTNYLYATRYSNGSGFSSFIFYNRYNSLNIFLSYFGGGERYNYFNLANNLLASATVQGGYNDLINHPEIKDYFVLQPDLLLRYRTTTFRVLYSYGPEGIPTLNIFNGNTPYPQLFSASVDNQYQFPGRHFVLNNTLTYSYYNVYASNSLTLSPELYYFTTSGWRFKIGFDYSFNSTNIGQYGFYAYPNAETSENTGPVVSDNIYINVGIKKQFGIPVPKNWAKYFYKTVTFISFLDLNGDGKKELNEAPVDNVVVHITNGPEMYEAITGDNGTAKILNLKMGRYSLTTIPLLNMKEWFYNTDDSINSNIKDTIYIPFVKGVKITGGIVYHPSKYSVNQTIDLHNIQVTATDIISGKSYDALTDAQGEYTMYVPVGKYTLTMNEDWLDDRFKVAQNNFTVALNMGMGSLYQSFYITEKQAPVEIKQFGTPTKPANTAQPPDEVPHH